MTIRPSVTPGIYEDVFEEWSGSIGANRQLSTDDLDTGESGAVEIRQSPTGDLDTAEKEAFMRIGFTHHIEIISKCKDFDERWYYIFRCASEFWTVEALKSHILAGDYQHYGKLPSSIFTQR